MNNYQINIDFTFKNLNNRIKQLETELQNIGKKGAFSGMRSELTAIQSQIKNIFKQIDAASATTSAKIAEQMKKAQILRSLGAGTTEIRAREAKALSFHQTQGEIDATARATARLNDQLNKAIVKAIEFEQGLKNVTSRMSALANMSNNVATGLKKTFADATAQAGFSERMRVASVNAANYAKNSADAYRALSGVMQSAGAKTGAFLDSAPAMRLAGSMNNLFSTLRRGVYGAIEPFQTTGERAQSMINRWNNSIRGSVSLMSSWWNHFGRIAIGFTIAYRAMNAFEALLGKTTETIKTSIKEAGELATLQGKLAMFTVMASKGTIGFDKAFRQSGQVVANLAQSSVRSISSIQELSVAMDELSQAGVLVPPNLTKEFVSFVDFTSLISQTTGDNVRQLRSEINALMEGQTRANNTLIRSMKNFGIITEEDIKSLRKMHNRAEVTENIMKKIHERWTEFIDKLLESNPSVALDVWEKSIRRLLTSTIGLVSNSKGQFNLFAATIKKHIDEWNKAFSDDMTKNLDVKRFAIMFVQLNKVLEFSLTAFEKMIKGIAGLATAFYNLDDSIKNAIKILLTWEALIVGYKAIKILTGAFVALNAGILALAGTLGPVATGLLAYGALGFLAANALSVLTGITISAEKPTNILTKAFEGLIAVLDKFKYSAIGAAIGFKLTKTWLGAAVGAAAGGAVDLISAMYGSAEDRDKQIAKLKKQDELLLEHIRQSNLALKTSLKDANDTERARVEAYIATLTKQRENIKENIRTLQAGPDTKQPSFVADVIKQTIESMTVAIDAGMTALAPYKKTLKKWWDELTFPNIDLTSKFKESTDPFEPITKSAEQSLEEIDKLLGSVSSNMYERFIKAVNDGKVALADLFAAPAKAELQYEINDLQKKIPLLKAALRLTEGTDEALKYKAALATVNAQIADLTNNLNDIDRQKSMAPAIAMAKQLDDELKRIKNTLVEGTPEYLSNLTALLEKYKDVYAGVDIDKEDYKQMDALNTYLQNIKEMETATASWKRGVQDAFDELRKPNTVNLMKDFVVSAFNEMEGAIVNFTTKGKQAFKDMAESILQDLLRIIVRMQIIQPIAQMMNMALFASPFELLPASTQSAIETYPISGIAHAKGGWLNEKVIGYGLSTGKLHTFAENEPEYITPSSQMGSGTVINIINNTPAQVRTEENSSRGSKRIDVYIDELIAAKLAGGSKSASVLRRVYGLTPALAGR